MCVHAMPAFVCCAWLPAHTYLTGDLIDEQVIHPSIRLSLPGA